MAKNYFQVKYLEAKENHRLATELVEGTMKVLGLEEETEDMEDFLDPFRDAYTDAYMSLLNFGLHYFEDVPEADTKLLKLYANESVEFFAHYEFKEGGYNG